MNSKKRSCASFYLYLILDKDVCGTDQRLRKVLTRAIAGGVDIVQFRDKFSTAKEMIRRARPLLKISRRHGVPFIINDRPDVAVATGADGVHIGQDDVPVDIARKMLGKNKIIGLSCHSLKEVQSAQREDADYLGFGPVFKTATKPNAVARGASELRRALRLTNKPVFAIGGITRKNISEIINQRAFRVAVLREICSARDPKRSALRLKRILAHV